MLEWPVNSICIMKGKRMTTEELHKAMGGFLIAMGQTLPVALADKIRCQAHLLAAEMERNGEPSVARLTKGFGDAVMASHEPTGPTN